MYNKPVETYVGTDEKAITDKPTLVFWLIVNGSSMSHRGILSILDGFSDKGTMKARVETYGASYPIFYPPIRCASGLYITINDRIFYYTVGYREEKDIPSLKQP